MKNDTWYVYILECTDGTLYTGVTTNVGKRFKKHKSGEGAKYTKAHKPKKIVYTEKCESKSDAFKREMEVKSLTKQKKLIFITSHQQT